MMDERDGHGTKEQRNKSMMFGGRWSWNTEQARPAM